MALYCDGCGELVYRTRYMPLLKKSLGIGKGSCDCAVRYLGMNVDAVAPTTVNPFDITFEHVNDEFGNKLHVSNLRQLSAAEKRLGFQSVVLNADAQNFDDPPQQKPVDVAAIHNWRHSNLGRYRENQRRRA